MSYQHFIGHRPKNPKVETKTILSPDSTVVTDGEPIEQSGLGSLKIDMSGDMQASFKTAVQIALAADEVMMNLGNQATDAICQAVRTALDDIWTLLCVRDAASLLKDVPPGTSVKSCKFAQFLQISTLFPKIGEKIMC